MAGLRSRLRSRHLTLCTIQVRFGLEEWGGGWGGVGADIPGGF
jgi:hypothetical protein